MTRDLQKLWTILRPPERRKSLVMLVLVVLMALAETAGVLSIMPFLSVLARPGVIEEQAALQWLYAQGDFAGHAQFITALGLTSIVVVVGSSAFKTITLHLINRFVYLLRHSISARMLGNYLRQPYEFFLQHNSAELGRNVLSEVDQLQIGLIQPVSQLIAQGAVVLAMVLVLFFYDPWIALVAVLVVGSLYGAIYGLVRKRLGRTGRLRQAANGQRFKACNEALGGIKDVLVTHSAAAYEQQFARASRDFSRHQANAQTLSQSPLYMVEAVGYTGLIVLALFLMAQSGDIGQVLPALGLYGFAAYRMLPSVQVMYRGFAQLRFSSAALDTIHDALTLPEGSAPHQGTGMLAPRNAIRLQGVRYAYPSSLGKPVFDGFDLTIPAQTSTGIAGASGAGKSTLMDLLLGLLQPQQGAILVDDTPISAANVAAWQRAIGYVPQHIYLADTSVAQNIAFGVATEDIDMRAVERAARAAQIHDFVTRELPQGYDTDIGERGIRLSGGQRQRIGIARALYRDPPVLLMDEATSALDGPTERAVNNAVAQLSEYKTIILIAHSRSTLDNCEIIIDISSSKNTVIH